MVVGQALVQWDDLASTVLCHDLLALVQGFFQLDGYGDVLAEPCLDEGMTCSQIGAPSLESMRDRGEICDVSDGKEVGESQASYAKRQLSNVNVSLSELVDAEDVL